MVSLRLPDRPRRGAPPANTHEHLRGVRNAGDSDRAPVDSHPAPAACLGDRGGVHPAHMPSEAPLRVVQAHDLDLARAASGRNLRPALPAAAPGACGTYSGRKLPVWQTSGRASRWPRRGTLDRKANRTVGQNAGAPVRRQAPLADGGQRRRRPWREVTIRFAGPAGRARRAFSPLSLARDVGWAAHPPPPPQQRARRGR